MMTNKNIYQRSKIAFKHAWNTPMLPPKVILFNDHPIIRILRVIGGLSVVTVLLKKHLIFIFPLNYIILFLSVLQMIYIVIISIIKIIYSIKQLKNNKLEIRNSPLDRYATVLSKMLYCWKVGCTVGQFGIGFVGTSVLADTVLEAGGHNKIFSPLISKHISMLIGQKPANSVYLEIEQGLSKMKDTKSKIESLQSIIEQAKTVFDGAENSNFTLEDINTIMNEFNELKNMEEEQLKIHADDLANKIKEISNKK